MGKLQNNQSGFSAVEAVLVVIIVALVGFTGWYVYHAQQAANKNLTPTSSGSPKFKRQAKTSSTSATNPSGTNTSSSSSSVFKISELGIEIINVPSSINDLTDYQYASNSGVDSNNTVATPVNFVAVQFSTQSLTKADPACSAKAGSSIGALARTEGTYVNNGPKDNTAFVKQFNGFYITYSHPEAACSNSTSPEALHGAQTATFQAVATNPANLQAL